MSMPKTAAVVHPDPKTRVALRSTLESLGCYVATAESCGDLLKGAPRLEPDLVLLDRSVLAREGTDWLTELHRAWTEMETVFLPDGLNAPGIGALTGILDRLLGMTTRKELLA
ncbi:MAG: hypothetical protein JO332_07535 [Planctomycetaceae bacterium]|nr:hypothetical protein [Planctomycetaceae bacterium]